MMRTRMKICLFYLGGKQNLVGILYGTYEISCSQPRSIHKISPLIKSYYVKHSGLSRPNPAIVEQPKTRYLKPNLSSYLTDFLIFFWL